MHRTSHVLTTLSVLAVIVGISMYAIAATCTGSLPRSNSIKGWTVVSDTKKAGQMGSKTSYDAFDGAVDAMIEQGISYFAQQMYKRSATKKYLTVDIYQLTSSSKARALYNKKRAAYKKAKPLTSYTSIKDRAFVGTLKSFTFGCCQRGKYVCEVSMSKASSSADRATAKSFLIYVSKKFGA